MKFLAPINLTLNELQNAKIHNLASAPTGYEGLVYYDTTIKKFGLYADGSWKYVLTNDLLAAVSGIATLNSSSLVVQNPASAATLSGGAAGKIPISSTGGKLDISYIPVLNNIPAPTAAVSLNNQSITDLADPTNPQDAATKNYVDNTIQGLDVKSSVRVISTGANITKTGTQTVDGVVLAIGDRILLKDQTIPAENGIWVVAAGAWSRAVDANSWSELVSAYVFVESGSSADTGWTCTVDPGGTLETTAVSWVQFSSAGTVTAANVGTGTGTLFRDKTGTTINIKTIKTGSTRLSITNNADDVTIDVNEANLVFANMTNSGTLAIAKGGTGTTTSTGTGSLVLSNSPTLVTPVLGAATATTINKVTITAPATNATLTLAQGSSLITSGAFALTLTITGTTNVTFPTSGTLLSTASTITVAQGGTGAVNAAGAKTNLGFMTRYSADIGNASNTSIDVVHGLNTRDVQVSVYEKATNAIVYPDIIITDVNTVSFVFSVAPTSNQYRVVIIG